MEKLIIEVIPPHGGAIHRYVVKSGNATIGRGYHCDVVLDDPYVSALHADITLAGSVLVLRDLGSENGVFIGKNRLREAQADLSSGHEFRIGRTKIKVFLVDHDVGPVLREGLAGKIRKFTDSRFLAACGLVLAMGVAALYGHVTDAANVDYWQEDSVYVGLIVFFGVLVVAAASYIFQVAIRKRVTPWARLINIFSSLAAIVLLWEIYVQPYLDFFVTDGRFSVLPSFIFVTALGLGAELFFCFLGDRKARRADTARILLAFMALYAYLTFSPQYDPSPRYPDVIAPGARPLTKPADVAAFLDKAYERLAPSAQKD